MAQRESLQKSVKSNKSLGTLNPQTIHNNALNNSISKMQYSFSKTPRFSEEKHKLNTHFYDIPTTLSKRGTSLGYGHKVDLSASKNPTPAPSQYKIDGEFNAEKKVGISFGLGRQDVKTNSMFVSGTDKVPAPNSYSPILKEPQIKYSMRAKLQDHTDKWIKQVPGPGTYNEVDPINEQCKNFVAKYETAPSAKFSILPRLVKDKLPLSPGPAQYDTSKQNSALAKFHSPVSSKFTVAKRKGPIEDNALKVPGPGQYNSFSEFLH